MFLDTRHVQRARRGGEGETMERGEGGIYIPHPPWFLRTDVRDVHLQTVLNLFLENLKLSFAFSFQCLDHI